MAKELGVVVITPLFEKRAAGVYHNSVVVLGPSGEQLGLYRKMHIPDDPLFYEKFYFTPGDLGFQAFATPFATRGRSDLLGPVVPGSGAADRAARGGDPVLSDGDRLAPERKGASTAPAQLSAWQTIQRAHAIANGVFVVGGEPRRPRGAGGRRTRVLGALVRVRSVRRGARRGRRAGRNAGRRMRPRAARKKCGAVGRFSATGASTRIPASTGACSIRGS